LTIHRGIYGESLDATLIRVGETLTDLVTVGAAGVIEFENPEERDWYEIRVLTEAKGVRSRRRPREVSERLATRDKPSKRGPKPDMRADRLVISAYLRGWRDRTGMSSYAVAMQLGTTAYYAFEGTRKGVRLSLPTRKQWLKLKEILGFDDTHDSEMLAE